MADESKRAADRIRRRAQGGAHAQTVKEAREASKHARIWRGKKR